MRKVLIAFRAWRDARARAPAEFASVLGPCPACGTVPLGHEHFVLASIITSRQPNRLEELERLAGQRRWRELSVLQEWEGLEDEVVFVAVTCPSTREVMLKKVCDSADAWADSHLLADIRLEASEQAEIEALGAGRWRPVSSRAEA